jgi:hypothetical protein
MARDLIPPPSPAGRPDPEGSATHRFVELPPEPVPEAPAPPPARGPRLPPSPYRRRFGFLAGALGGVVLASIAIVVALIAFDGGADDDGMHPNWSAWRPDDETLADGGEQIAQHVGAQYKGTDGNQLVRIKVVTDPVPITLHSSTVADLTGDTVIYQLAGFNPDGSIEGELSNERGALVFREALELSLYSFRYLPDAKGVMVLVPPPPTDPGEAAEIKRATEDAATDPEAAAKVAAFEQQAKLKQRAVYFRPGDLKPELQVPLDVTVPPGTPTADTLSQAEMDTILARVRPNLFLWQLNDMTGEITLTPMPSTP